MTLARHSCAVLIALVLSGCVEILSPPLPPANLNFVGIASTGQGDLRLAFTSDVDLLSPEWTEDGRAALNPHLFCSLDGDATFSLKHVMPRALEGTIGPESQVVRTKSGAYTYAVEMLFYETRDGGVTNTIIGSSDARGLIARRTTIPCKVVRAFPFSFTKPYYSKPMHVPVSALLHALDNPQPREAQ